MHSNSSTGLAIVGAGSLGQAFAAALAANGRPVTLLATPTSAARLREAGCIRLEGVLNLEASVAPAPAPAGVVGVTTDPSQLPRGTGLIFTTKGHQLPAAIAAVQAVWPAPNDDDAWVAGVQNGIVKDDLLVRAFGAGRVVGAVTILGAQRLADTSGPSRVSVSSTGMTYFGELDGRRSARAQAAVDIFRACGLPAEVPESIQSVLWSKACNAVGVFGVSVPARSSAPRMMRNPHLVRAYLSLIREAAAVAAAHGVAVGDYAGFPIRTYVERSDDETIAALAERIPPPRSGSGGPEGMPSMTQDLLAGRPLEADEIFGDLVERAERVGVPVPRMTFVRDLLLGLDPGRER